MFEISEIYQLKNKQNELAQLLTCNEKTEQFGLTLSTDQANELTISRDNSLKKYERVEFGKGILEALIFEFCDSQYINQEEYLTTLIELQDIFYAFKNASEDKLTDDELLVFMREQFESVCFGDLEYLSETCLPIFTEAIRAGYTGYQKTGGQHEYAQFDLVKRWDKDTYLQVVKELFWG
jgi:hypothetical protein